MAVNEAGDGANDAQKEVIHESCPVEAAREETIVLRGNGARERAWRDIFAVCPRRTVYGKMTVDRRAPPDARLRENGKRGLCLRGARPRAARSTDTPH